MGVNAEPDSLEEAFLIRGLKRLTIANLNRDRMFLEAMSDNPDRANEVYKRYVNMMVPELGIQERDQEKEMKDSFEYFKQFEHKIKMDEKGNLTVAQEKKDA